MRLAGRNPVSEPRRWSARPLAAIGWHLPRPASLPFGHSATLGPPACVARAAPRFPRVLFYGSGGFPADPCPGPLAALARAFRRSLVRGVVPSPPAPARPAGPCSLLGRAPFRLGWPGVLAGPRAHVPVFLLALRLASTALVCGIFPPAVPSVPRLLPRPARARPGLPLPGHVPSLRRWPPAGALHPHEWASGAGFQQAGARFARGFPGVLRN